MAGGGSSPLLVSSVANEGVLGFLAAGYLSAEALEKQILETKLKTNNIFGVNLFIIDPINKKNVLKPESICNIEKKLGIYRSKKLNISLDEQTENKIDLFIKHKIKFVSFTFGVPSKKLIDKLKKNNIYTIGSCTNIIEAKIIEEAGLDAVVAQGVEAGGHRASFLNHKIRDEIGLFSLLQELSLSIKIPIIASGGIVSGKGVLASQILGAASVQIGTGFLLTEESGVSKSYKDALLDCHAHETTFTEHVSGKKAQGKSNLLIEALYLGKSKKLKFPVQNAMTKDIRGFANTHQNSDYMSLWCGQSVWGIKKIISAKEFIHKIMDEYEDALSKIRKNNLS
jgi:nitronate monooxygenase